MVWSRPDGRRIVWRCINRLEHGKKICKKSPTWNEADIHTAVTAAMNGLFHAQTAKEALEASITAAAFDRRMEEIANELEKTAGAITEFDEVTVRQLVNSIKVISKDTLLVCFKDGTEIMQTIGSIGRVRA